MGRSGNLAEVWVYGHLSTRVARNFIPNKHAFLSIVIDTRNSLTHSGNAKKNAVSGNALFFAVEQLRLLVEICPLTEAG
ncbi:MAG: HEPN domain-containing protein [Halobacteriota archaeon]